MDKPLDFIVGIRVCFVKKNTASPLRLWRTQKKLIFVFEKHRSAIMYNTIITAMNHEKKMCSKYWLLKWSTSDTESGAKAWLCILNSTLFENGFDREMDKRRTVIN